jgi:chorismate mutase
MHELAGYVALEGRDFSLSAPPIDHAFDTHRNRIDRFDEIIVRMLSERAKLALELARVKSSLGLPVLAPARESAVLKHVRQVESGPLGAEAIGRIYEAIIKEMRDIASTARAREGTVNERAKQSVRVV